jgi:hypothetical protein
MAHEKFEERKLTGRINVACKYDDGTVRYWQDDKETICEHIKLIVDDYRSDGLTLTLRQLHYQLVTRNWIINHDTAYKKLGTILDDLRYSGEIDWDAIEDRGRVPYLPYWVRGVDHAIQDTIDQYRRDLQDGQENHVEVWTEKDALSGILRRVTNPYHVRLVVNKGYTSSTAIYNAYQRFVDAMKSGQNVVVLYFGDHDPSGLDMVRDIKERLEFMFGKGDHYYDLFDHEEIGTRFRVVHIGLTKAQIREYNPPPNPTKLTDTRAAKYISVHGRTCWEVDALNPRTLIQIVEQHIQNEIDMDLYNDMLKKQEKDIATIKKKFKID